MKPSIYILAISSLLSVSQSLYAQSDFDSLVEVQSENILKEVEIEESTIEAEIEYVSSIPKVRLLPSASWNESAEQSECLITEVTGNSLSLLREDGEELFVQLRPADYFIDFLDGRESRIGTVVTEISFLSMSADQSLRLFFEDTLALGYVWKTAGQPVSILDNDGIAIVQQLALTHLPGGDSIALVPVQVNTDEGMIEIPTGETVDFYRNGIPYQVYVVFSEYQPSSYEMEDSRSGYLLHAILISMSSNEEQLLQENNQGISIHNNNTLHSAEDPEGSVKAYPNPAAGYFIFEVENLVPVLLEIYDITGHQALVVPLSKARNWVNVEKNGLGKGMYFWIAKDNAGQLVRSGKIAIQ